MTTLIINFLINFLSFLFIFEVIRIQIKLKKMFSGDEFNGIRTANILTSSMILLICIIRIIFFTIEILKPEHEHITITLLYWFSSIAIFVIAKINFLFYKGFEFKIISKIND